jgi:hypothetical protein
MSSDVFKQTTRKYCALLSVVWSLAASRLNLQRPAVLGKGFYIYDRVGDKSDVCVAPAKFKVRATRQPRTTEERELNRESRQTTV